MPFKLDEDKFMASVSGPGSNRSKAKWHKDRFGTGAKNATLEAAGSNYYQAELKERGLSKDHLDDHERAHSGQPGAKVRHGNHATGIPMRNMSDFDKL